MTCIFVVLQICRQHFLDRITWCISRMSSAIANNRRQGSDHERHSQFDTNFVTSMDYALELIEPLTMFGGVVETTMPTKTIPRTTMPPVKICYAADGKPNTAALRAEVRTIRIILLVHMLTSTLRLFTQSILTGQHIRRAVNSVIGHALTFANVALPADRRPITTVCQTVLRLCISFEQSTGLATHDTPNSTTAQMCATALESALYQLDGLLNDCLLRLVFNVFGMLERRPVQRLRHLIASAASQDSVDAQIEQFDVMTDRLHQIGIFAAAFASTQADRTRIRSAIASAESLEPVLVPALLAPVTALEPNCALLVRHWQREMNRLRRTVQSIIDTDAFCGSLFDQLTSVISQQQQKQQPADGRAAGVRAWLDNCAVLLQHLDANREELQLDVCQSAPASSAADDRRLMHADLALMLDECRAAVDACGPAEWQRVIKRLKIMQRVLKKFRATLDKGGEDANARGPMDLVFGSLSIKTSQPQAQSVSTKAELSMSSESIFDVAGISRKISGMLYQSNRLQRRCRAVEEPPAIVTNLETDESGRIAAELMAYHSGQTGREKPSSRRRVTKSK